MWGPELEAPRKATEERLNAARQELAPPESTAEFAQRIRFEYCPPVMVGKDNMFAWEPERCIEYLNTTLPVDDRAFKERLYPIADVPRMSTLAIAAVINHAVRNTPEDQAFLNVGVWNGYSFLAALMGNPDKLCIGVDNFSQFGGPVDDFRKRFEAFRGPAHSFYDLDYQEYLRTRHQGPLGVYFYDGEHSYKNQFMGLKEAEKFFAEGCLILVDDTNWEEPSSGHLRFHSNQSPPV